MQCICFGRTSDEHIAICMLKELSFISELASFFLACRRAAACRKGRQARADIWVCPYAARRRAIRCSAFISFRRFHCYPSRKTGCQTACLLRQGAANLQHSAHITKFIGKKVPQSGGYFYFLFAEPSKTAKTPCALCAPDKNLL